MDGHRGGRGQCPDHLPPGEVVFVAGLQHAADGECRHAASGIIGVAVGAAGAGLIRHIPHRVIGERPAATGTEGHGAQLVGTGGIGVAVGDDAGAGVAGVGHAVADPVIDKAQRAIGAGGRGKAFARGLAEGLGIGGGLQIGRGGQAQNNYTSEVASRLFGIDLPLPSRSESLLLG